MIELELVQLLIKDSQDPQIIVLREKGGLRGFPIMVGRFEALSIHRKIHDAPVYRPMTHDLLASVIEQLDGKLTRIVITDMRDDTFFAKLVIYTDGNYIDVDSRPSDAVALAVRVGAPIFVEEDVLDRVGHPM